MSKFIGIKNGRIQVVSDSKFTNAELQVLELPSELNDVPVEQLLLDYVVKNGSVFHKDAKHSLKDLKIAIVSNYGQACGLSTYIENLLQHLIPKMGEYRLFAEYNSNPTKANVVAPNKISYCWSRGKPLENLIKELKDYNPDIILINHEYGLFPNARYWMAMMTQLSSFKTAVILHSIFPYHLDKTIVEASIKNIIVHSEGARSALADVKGIAGSISVIPHGCYAAGKQDRLWNFYKSNATFITNGFAFKYKSFDDCIRATALLKDKYPDIFFTALLSESNHAKLEHENYYKSLMELIDKLKLHANVALIRGFQTDEVMDAFLRINKVAVFPYKIEEQHFVHGASGAARLAMSKGIPVISSSIPHFQDTPTIKADTVEEIAQKLDMLFSNGANITNQVKAQNAFIAANSWEITANKYVSVLETIKQA